MLTIQGIDGDSGLGMSFDPSAIMNSIFPNAMSQDAAAAQIAQQQAPTSMANPVDYLKSVFAPMASAVSSVGQKLTSSARAPSPAPLSPVAVPWYKDWRYLAGIAGGVVVVGGGLYLISK